RWRWCWRTRSRARRRLPSNFKVPQAHGERPGSQLSGWSASPLRRESARDVRAVVARDAVGIGLEIDRGDRDELAVQGHGEVLVDRHAEHADLNAAKGQPRGKSLEPPLADTGEAELDVGRTGLVGGLPWVADA